jgi:hypothetical protein
MSDNKLDKLIEDLTSAIVAFIRSPQGTPKNLNLYIQDRCKAKQAIVDYVEQEKREFYDKGYEKAVALWSKSV